MTGGVVRAVIPAYTGPPPGAGKTLAYLLPLLTGLRASDRNLALRRPSVVVLVPSTELGRQILVRACMHACVHCVYV